MEPIKTNDFEPPETPRRVQGMPWWPAAVVILLLIGVAAWYFWSRTQTTELPTAGAPQAQVPPPEPAPALESTPSTEPDLPALAESDPFLREIAARLSSHPEWLSWLANDNLARRFVAAVDEVARGELPTAQARFLSPSGSMSPVTRQGRLYLGSESHERYGRLIAVVSGLDAAGVASLYGRLRPMLREAYRDLGYPRADFDAALSKAIGRLLETPEPRLPPELSPTTTGYKYTDPELEALPPVQKLLIRLGPDGAARVKSKLREIAAELDRAQVAGQD